MDPILLIFIRHLFLCCLLLVLIFCRILLTKLMWIRIKEPTGSASSTIGTEDGFAFKKRRMMRTSPWWICPRRFLHQVSSHHQLQLLFRFGIQEQPILKWLLGLHAYSVLDVLHMHGKLTACSTGWASQLQPAPASGAGSFFEMFYCSYRNQPWLISASEQAVRR